MKYSQFNSFLPYHDNYVLYNSLTQKLLMLNESLKNLITSSKEHIESVQIQHPKLFGVLISNGFYVDNDVDEVDIVRKNIERIDSDSRKYMLMINPTMSCNFKCWYCYEEHIKGSKVSDVNLNNIKSHIQNIVRNNQLNLFALSFFGGEPLLYFKDICYPIIQEWHQTIGAKDIERSLNFTTNGYLINNQIIDTLKPYMDYTHMYITLDGYKEEHDKVRYISLNKGSYGKIIENIIKLTNIGFRVTLRINYTHDKLENSQKILEDLKKIKPDRKKNITISLHCVWQTNKDMNNRHKELFQIMSHFSDAGFTTNSPMHLRTVEQMCYGDKRNTAIINYNGDVFKCSARKFDPSQREGYLDNNGYIIWDKAKINQRMSSKLKNKPCLSCRILPHCLGSCTQHQMEASLRGIEYCVHEFDEKKIDDIIIDHIDRVLDVQRRKMNAINLDSNYEI